MTAAEIERAIDAILEWEGTGYTPGDQAAGDPPTLAGIAAPTWGQYWRLGRDATADEVRLGTMREVRQIYRDGYILGPQFDQVADPVVRQAAIDFGVNSGVERSVWYLQKAVGVYPDMRIGPLTLAAVNAADPVRLLGTLVRARVGVLTRWIRARPAARGTYVGVIDRAVSFLPAL